MTPDLSCYGADISALTEIVGDFDLRSPIDTRAWFEREGHALADHFGFSQQFATALARQRGAREWVTAIDEASTSAFASWLRENRPAITDPQAAIQTSVIKEMVAASRMRGELWRVTIDPTTLTTGACYADEQGGSSRAFYPDTAPGYFGDGWPGPPPRATSRCGWQTPLVLHFGTFPWIYSSRIDATGPGLRWVSPSIAPAVDAFRIMTSFLQPEVNLQQDARQVAAIFQEFRKQTTPLIASLSVFRGGASDAGRLYRRAGLLYVPQGSLHVASLDGPRGRIPATAYNHIMRRFACFFAVRRATVHALTTWAPEMRQLVTTSSDPYLRSQVEGVARTG